MPALQFLRVGKLRPGAGPVVGPDQSKVGIFIPAKHPALDDRTVRCLDGDGFRIADDVIVGNDETVGRDGKAGTMPCSSANALDTADRRTDHVDGIRHRFGIGIQQPGV